MIASQPELEALRERAQHLAAQRDLDPYNRRVREELSEVHLRLFKEQHPLGTPERGQVLLQLLGAGFPTANLNTAYFENMEQMLARRPRRSSPGKIVLGLGTGRCGSTSLCGILAGIKDSCCTHENPPFVYWHPEKEQWEFHRRRFRLLSQFFPLVFDAAHWWLPCLDKFFAAFPQSQAIGLQREAQACARSFLMVKGQGLGSINHWVAPGNDIWGTNLWDPTYPTYPLPDHAADHPDQAKLTVILRYIQEYNSRLVSLRNRFPDRLLLVSTQELSHESQQKKIFDFLGLQGTIFNKVLNVGAVGERTELFRF